MKLLREPLLHFLLIGAAIYGLYALSAAGGDGDEERTVTVTSGDIQALSDHWTRLWNRPPTEAELAGIIRDHVRIQILQREARAMGLDDGDRVIERRLAQKVELLAKGLITPDEPAEAELRAWYADNPGRFRQPDLYTVTHIFFDPDKRGAATLDDARATLDALKTRDVPPPDYGAYGDRFMLQTHYPNRSELELRKLFGSGFADQIVALEPGIWHGPVLSGYGTHLVLVNAVVRPPRPAYEAVEAQIKEAWMAERIEELSERFLADLIDRYEVVVEDTEVPITVAAKDSRK